MTMTDCKITKYKNSKISQFQRNCFFSFASGYQDLTQTVLNIILYCNE